MAGPFRCYAAVAAFALLASAAHGSNICLPLTQIFITWDGHDCDSNNGIPCDAHELVQFHSQFIPPETIPCQAPKWDFGDGTISRFTYSPSHAFPAAGHYRVSLEGSDGHDPIVVSTILYVEDPWCRCNTGAGQVLQFSASSRSVVRGQPVVLTWRVSGASRVRIDPLNVEFPVTPPYSTAISSYTFVPKETATYTMTAYSFAANGLSTPLAVTVGNPRRRGVRH